MNISRICLFFGLAVFFAIGAQAQPATTVYNEAELQAAVQNGGWIKIGGNGRIVLTSTLQIFTDVALDGTGVSAAIDGGGSVQLFNVNPGAALSVTNLTLTGGASISTNSGITAQGGAILNLLGNVTLTRCIVSNNVARSLGDISYGGAIYTAAGVLEIYDSVIVSNTAYGVSAYGGAISDASGIVIINGSAITGNYCSGNYAGGGAYGGALSGVSDSLLLTNTVVAGNKAVGGAAPEAAGNYTGSRASGGAFACFGGTVALNLCQFVANSAQGGNGSPDGVGASASGGALYCAATLSAVSCSFLGNQSVAGQSSSSDGATALPSGMGGGIYGSGDIALIGCLISSNACIGGAPEETLTPQNGGSAMGGGIYDAGAVAATNCTLALNTAIGAPGAAVVGLTTPGAALGGGVYCAASSTLVGVNVTVASNTCISYGSYLLALELPSLGFAAGAEIATTNAAASILNSVLAYGGAIGNAYGPVTDLGDNISSDATAPLQSGSSRINSDPMLEGLANNGGPTLTMALNPASPTISYANSVDGAPAFDQRGYPRPDGKKTIDLGAFQAGASLNPSLSIAGTFPNILVTVTTSPFVTNSVHFQSSTNMVTWTDVQVIGALSFATNILHTVSPQSPPRQFFRLTW